MNPDPLLSYCIILHMKTFRLLVLLAALIFAGVAAPSRARAQDDAVSFDFFYDSLAPYGEWIEVGDYGLCWRPGNVDPDWTPYSDGYWAYTDAGWTWVSYEEFGGIVYHYGRWLHLDDDSWCWTPGYEWAPAWVSWRSSDEYVGWAPLPPEARWAQDTGISVWVDSVCGIGPGYYNFCRARDFGAPVLRGVLCRRSENVVIIRSTVNITNITYNTVYVGGPVIFNGGPVFDVISRRCERPIPTLKLVQNAHFDATHWRDHRGPGGRLGFNAETVGNELIVAAPRVLRPANIGEFKSRAKKMLPGESVTKGWDVVKNPETRRDLHAEIDRQAKGLNPQTAPARKVAAADLKVVPATANPMAVPPGGDRHDKFGKGPRPESAETQPGNTPGVPPSSSKPVGIAPPGRGTPPTSASTVPSTPEGTSRDRRHGKNVPPTSAPNEPATGSVLKPFNPNADTQPPQQPAPRNVPPNNNPSTVPVTPGAPGGGRGRGDVVPEDRAAETKTRIQEQRAAQQQKRDEMATQQQQQKAEQLEAARAQAEERRRAFVEQQQQLRQQQLQQLQQQQQQRNNDARRANEAEKDRDRERQQSEPPRNSQMQQRQGPPPQGNPPSNQGSPRQGGGHSKDGKDKDKDKNGN